MDNSKKKSLSILSQWKKSTDSEKKTVDTIVNRPKAYQASDGQQRLYFLDQLHPNNPVYNLTEVWGFNGPLNVEMFLNAIAQIGKRQDLLRASFHLKDDKIECRIGDKFEYLSEKHDLSSLQRNEADQQFSKIAQEVSRYHFDLASGSLLKVSICTFSPTIHKVIVNIHHIISDKSSMRLFRNELAEVYSQLKEGNAPSLKPLAAQFYERAIDNPTSTSLSRVSDYWKAKLKGPLQYTSLPSDKGEQNNSTLKGKYASKPLPTALSDSVTTYCKEQAITPFIFFLGVYKLIIARYCKIDDVLIGTPISTRTKPEYEYVQGFFNDTIVLRNQVDQGKSFNEYIHTVKNTVFEAFEHKEIGFQNLMNAVKPDRVGEGNPFFQMMFLYHHKPVERAFAADIDLTVSNYDMGVAKFHFTLYIEESDGEYDTIVEYATEMYSEDYVDRFQSHYIEVITQLMDRPSQQLGNINMLSTEEQALVKRLGRGPKLSKSPYRNVLEAIKEYSSLDTIALTDSRHQISYQDLHYKSNAIANILISKGKTSGFVGILMSQSTDFVVSMIGILKAGCAYLPLDVDYPVEHINHAILSAKVDILITSQENPYSDNLEIEAVIYEEISPIADETNISIDPSNPAYLIFTSGSTGKPNGVVVTHKNLLNSTLARFEYYQDHPSSYLLLSSFSFDSSVAGIYWTLLNGGKIVIPSKTTIKDTDCLGDLIRKESITHTLLIPSLYQVYLEVIPTDVLANLNSVILAGEALTISIAKQHFSLLPQVRLYNEYGPTEATVWITAHEVLASKISGSVPIGKCIGNNNVYVLDAYMNFVPVGIPGELYISGDSLSNGYLHSDGKANAKFSKLEIDGQERRIYRTGDWVKWGSDGQLYFLGRQDHQVKIRGHRIELGEVDETIQAINSSVKSVTVYQQKEQLLVTYLVSDNPIDISKLEVSLQSKLPKHYWPDHLLAIDEFPLMANGKTNIRDLQKRIVKVKSDKQVAKSIEGETQPLLQIWRDVLNNENIGLNDNFFEVGGDSIQLIRIVAKARKSGIQLSAKDIYNNQTVASLIPKQSQENHKSPESTPWTYLPLTPIQAWFFEEFQSKPDHWLQGYRLTLSKPQTVQLVKDVIKQLIDFESIFRVVFTRLYGKWHMAQSSNHIDDYIELTASGEVKTEGLSLTEGPLIKFYLEKEGDKVTRIIIIAHHLIIDAVSWHHILNRFNDELGSKEITNTRKSENFLHWTREINLYAQTKLFDNDLPFWQDQISKKSQYFEGKENSIEGNVKTVKLKISAQITHNLIGSLIRYSSIKLNEAIIAAFAHSFYRVTHERNVTLMLEGHGRDASFTQVELSEAIGWFTSYYPVAISLSDSSDEFQSLIDVKEQVRQVPNNGISYGALRYLSGKLRGESNAFVTINHLGDLSQSDYDHLQGVEFLSEGMRSRLSERQSLIEINTHIDHGELVLNYSYDAVLLDNEKMEDILNGMHSYLRKIPETLSTRDTRLTPSDFQYAVSSEDLDHIVDTYDTELETIIPLTSTQSALLFHHLQAGSSDQGLIKASVILHGEVEESRLQEAWQALVRTHDVLRSFFLWEGLSNSVQVVAKSVESAIVFHNAQEIMDEHRNKFIQQIIDKEWSNFALNRPPILRMICIKESDTRHHLIFLCHHIYIDGWSTNVIFKDLVELYDSSDYQQILQRPKLINWYQQVEFLRKSDELKEYWQRTMMAASPSLLKSTDQVVKNEFAIDQFALSESQTLKLLETIKSSKLTLSVVLTGLWSWLLSRYLDQSVVSMGMIHSGRSVEIDGVDDMVGMLSRVLPMIYSHSDRGQIDFEKIQSEFNEVLKRDAISIEDIPALDQSKIRYDTLLIIENFMSGQSQDKQLQYTDFKSNISSLMPLCIIIVPGDQLTFKLRYNVHQYSTSEIHHIREDLLSVLNGLQFNGKIASVESEQLYRPVISTSTTLSPTESELQLDDKTNLDEALLLIWKDVINDQAITQRDNFFEIGGTSLMAVRIFNTINKQLGINASPILLLKHKTIAELAPMLQTSSVEDSWKCLHPLSDGGDGNPLFCFHAGEGHILFYNELAQNITNRPVYGIQPVGLDGQQIQFESIEEMADYYLTQIKAVYPTGPYHLLGTCFSNAVTFEMARQLKAEMGQLIFVDSPPPYFNELSKLKKWMSWLYTFNIPKLWEAFNNYFKYSTLKAPTDEQERNLFNTGKQLRTIMSTYQWTPQDLEIVLIRSKENAEDKFKSYHIDNWQLLAKRGVITKTIEGKHLTVFEGKSATQMAEVIESALSNNV